VKISRFVVLTRHDEPSTNSDLAGKTKSERHYFFLAKRDTQCASLPWRSDHQLQDGLCVWAGHIESSFSGFLEWNTAAVCFHSRNVPSELWEEYLCYLYVPTGEKCVEIHIHHPLKNVRCVCGKRRREEKKKKKKRKLPDQKQHRCFKESKQKSMCASWHIICGNSVFVHLEEDGVNTLLSSGCSVAQLNSSPVLLVRWDFKCGTYQTEGNVSFLQIFFMSSFGVRCLKPSRVTAQTFLPMVLPVRLPLTWHSCYLGHR